jgi:hypothetical protein
VTHRTAALLLSLATVTVVAGCAGGEVEALAPAAPPVERPAPGPLWAYLERVDPGQATRAHEEKMRACMADAELLYWPDDPNNELTQDTLPIAREWGYGGLSLQPATAAQQNAAYVRTLSEQGRRTYDAALDACAIPPVEAPAALWPEDPDFADLHADLEDWVLAVIDDPRVHEADEPWSECMAAAGHDVGSPDEAEEQAAAAAGAGLFSDPEVQEAEIALAVADLTCRDSTGYTVANRAAWDLVQQEFVDAHREQLDALVEAHALDRS